MEILVTVSIIGLLSGFVIVQMQSSGDVAEDMKRKSDIEVIKNAIIAYRSDNYNNVPIESCNIGENCTEDINNLLLSYTGSIPAPDSETSYTYLSVDGSDCLVSTELSDSSLYQYSCLNDELSYSYPVGGTCGMSNLGTFGQEPVTGLCSSGTSSVLNYSETNSAWSWNCVGENGGATSSCLAFFESNYLACSIIPAGDTCSVSLENQDDPSASAVSVFNIHSLTGGHAELATQTNYSNKVCCEGSSLSNECLGGTAVLNLYDVTNAHVEKNTQTYYSNSVCLSGLLKNITCSYASDCLTLGEDYVCLASIPAGDTNLHVGDCSAYSTKVCCQLQSE
ncbi:MAG: hypothetical protein XD75_0167 [Parcubacteria bacterium 33_209]|nr:MAG: hypothetical protein XD75_0167 [Parcubacteria bacterium 33_209]